MLDLRIEPSPAQVSLSDRAAALARVAIVLLQATRQLVRRLLNYLRAHDFDGARVQRSLQQLTSVFAPFVLTCLHTICRVTLACLSLCLIAAIAVKYVNRYSINWNRLFKKSRARSKRGTIQGTIDQTSGNIATHLAQTLANGKRLSRWGIRPSGLSLVMSSAIGSHVARLPPRSTRPSGLDIRQSRVHLVPLPSASARIQSRHSSVLKPFDFGQSAAFKAGAWSDHAPASLAWRRCAYGGETSWFR